MSDSEISGSQAQGPIMVEDTILEKSKEGYENNWIVILRASSR